VTLHRPPPDTRTLDKILEDFSKIVTVALGLFSLDVMAAINPAAPAPITAIFITLFLYHKDIQYLSVGNLSHS
jgi:hypothetical protein